MTRVVCVQGGEHTLTGHAVAALHQGTPAKQSAPNPGLVAGGGAAGLEWARLGLDLRLLPADGAAADDAAAVLALDAAADADVFVPNEAPDGVGPALVAGQVLVKLPGHVVDGGQAGPGHGGEVVVLVVQADVVREPVEGPVVGKGLGDGDAVVRVALRLGDRLVHVVLGDEVAGQRVEAAGEEGGEQEVGKGGGRGEADEGDVEGDLDEDVEVVHPGKGDAVDGHGADGVKEDLEGAEKGLAENRVEHQGLGGGGQIRV